MQAFGGVSGVIRSPADSECCRREWAIKRLKKSRATLHAGSWSPAQARSGDCTGLSVNIMVPGESGRGAPPTVVGGVTQEGSIPLQWAVLCPLTGCTVSNLSTAFDIFSTHHGEREGL
jgi:hypothetical protein